MPLPDKDTPWPPPQLAGITPVMEEHAAWYAGDVGDLARVYQQSRGPANRTSQLRGGVVGAVARMWWGQPVNDLTQSRRKLHIPIAADLCQAGADLLFAEPPTLTVTNAKTQKRLALLADDGLFGTLGEAAEIAGALGGVFLRVSWDDQVLDRPFLSKVDADAAVPEFRSGRLWAVTFWWRVRIDGQRVWRHLERHETVNGIGVILHGLYEGTGDSLGRNVPLLDDPSTAGLAPQLSDGQLISTLTPGLAVVYVPNMRPQRRWRNDPLGANLGRSTLDGIEGLMDSLDEAYCADEETEILTEHGWVGFRDLRPGDSVLTLNHESGLSEWQPVAEVCIFPAIERQMVSIESRSHSSLTTPNHRWPVLRPHYRDGEYKAVSGADRKWATSETFLSDDRVPVAADCADLPVEPKLSDALVELAAWFWTEGHIRKLRSGVQGRNVTISQSYVVNPDHCDRIRSVLTRLFGAAVDAFPRWGHGATDGVPRWRERLAGSNVVFSLSADAGDLVQALAPGRVPSFDFLRSLTRAQLSLFIEVSMLADNSGQSTLAQKDPAAAEAFQFACILAGYGTSIRPAPRRRDAHRGYSMRQVRIRDQRAFWPGRPGVRDVVAYSGHVWCPVTPNQTWMARRRGTVYFTGNTSWMRDIRLGKARIVVPGYMLESQGAGQGGTVDLDREVYEGINATPQENVGVNLIQSVIRYEAHAATVGRIITDIIRSAGYSAQTLGEGAGSSDTAITATEVSARERRSNITRDRQLRMWRPAVGDIAGKLLAIDAVLFRSGVAVERPVVDFNESVQPEPLATAQTAQALSNARAASTRTLVSMVHRDWDNTQIDDEVRLILAEDGVAPDPTVFRPGVDDVAS